MRPLRDSTARLRFDYGIVRTRSSHTQGGYLGNSSHSLHPFPFNHDLHPSFHLVGYKVPERIALNMSSDYSPPSSSGHHASRDNLYGAAASDANIRNFAPVARIMKTALPENAKIAKEAKECMQECVSEFISFITSEGKSTAPERFSSQSLTKILRYSFRKMSAGKTKDGKRRGYSLRNDVFRLRELRRSSENLPCQISRSEFCLTTLPLSPFLCHLGKQTTF